MLKKVLIEPSCSARRAEEFINECIEEYQDENTEVEFEMLLENSTQIGKSSYIYYTVVVTISEKES